MNKKHYYFKRLWRCKLLFVLILVSLIISCVTHKKVVLDRGEPLIPFPQEETLKDSSIVPELATYKGPSQYDINASTIKGKVLCGYQGWFRAVGDGVVNEWRHWSLDPNHIAPNTLSFEMWPDLSEYPDSEKFPATGMKHSDGSPAYLFSSIRPAVVDLHFKWMRQYGIDGVFVQRFLTDIDETNSLKSTGVLAYARNAANKYGRVFCITYDITGTDVNTVFDKMSSDWKFLVDSMQITKDKRYLHHNGKPVLMIWGIKYGDIPSDLAEKIIQFFKNDPKYGTSLVGGIDEEWKETTNSVWAKIFRSLDVISPWNVGRQRKLKDKTRIADTSKFRDDLIEAHRSNALYMPVIYPGFSWDNLMGNRENSKGHSLIPRRGGHFLWEQFYTVSQIKPDAVYVAMFDEVDEGTAIFKVTNNPPVNAHFVTYEGKPSDLYLYLTGYGTRMYRGEVPLQEKMPE